MTASKFLQLAQTLEVDISLKLTGEPRGSLERQQGLVPQRQDRGARRLETVWAQVGLNITIPGSNQWRADGSRRRERRAGACKRKSPRARPRADSAGPCAPRRV